VRRLVDVAVQDRTQDQAVAVFDSVPPLGLVLGAITSIQFGAALAATLFDDLGPAGTSALRLGFAAVVLVVLVRPRVRSHTREDLRLAVVFGLVLGLMNLVFYLALDRIALGIAVTLEFVGPLAVAVLLSRRRLDLVWALLAAAGIVLLAHPGGDADALGVIFALLAGVCWGVYILLNKSVGQRFSGGDALAIAMVPAALVPLVPGIAEAGADLLDPELLALGFGVALLSSVVPYTLEVEALRRMPANVFGVLMSLEPAVAAVAGFIVLSQDLDAQEIAAIALVVAASAGATRTTPPGPPEPE
jgi:inner membrane transporter RhtA